MSKDPTELHRELGTDEWCRRLDMLKPMRQPLYDRRDQVHARLMQTDQAFWVWIETNEAQLPAQLQELRQHSRDLQREIQSIDKRCDQLWLEIMEAVA